MSNCKVTVQAGICGFVTEVKALNNDDETVSFEVNSPCPNITALAAKLQPVDAYMELRDGFNGHILSTVRESLRGGCSGCVVPSGIFKAMQVAAGLALPKDIALSVEATA